MARVEALQRRADRLEHARELERNWNHELRERLYELQRERGLLGDTSDVRALVLHLALTILGADKGLLLSREDADEDGDLDTVCAEGFDNDPEASAVAQHFAGKVLERDETVRADDPEELELGERTAADAEIDNLVAIPIYIRDRFHGVVICANKPGGFTDYDDDVLLALGDHAGFALQNARLRGQVRGSLLATVRVLVEAIEAKDRRAPRALRRRVALRRCGGDADGDRARGSARISSSPLCCTMWARSESASGSCSSPVR